MGVVFWGKDTNREVITRLKERSHPLCHQGVSQCSLPSEACLEENWGKYTVQTHWHFLQPPHSMRTFRIQQNITFSDSPTIKCMYNLGAPHILQQINLECGVVFLVYLNTHHRNIFLDDHKTSTNNIFGNYFFLSQCTVLVF